MPRRRRAPRRHWYTKYLEYLPPADSPLWAVGRLVVLVVFMYHNASNFDMTEGKTIIAVALMEALGLKKSRA